MLMVNVKNYQQKEYRIRHTTAIKCKCNNLKTAKISYCVSCKEDLCVTCIMHRLTPGHKIIKKSGNGRMQNVEMDPTSLGASQRFPERAIVASFESACTAPIPPAAATKKPRVVFLGDDESIFQHCQELTLPIQQITGNPTTCSAPAQLFNGGGSLFSDDSLLFYKQIQEGEVSAMLMESSSRCEELRYFTEYNTGACQNPFAPPPTVRKSSPIKPGPSEYYANSFQPASSSQFKSYVNSRISELASEYNQLSIGNSQMVLGPLQIPSPPFRYNGGPSQMPSAYSRFAPQPSVSGAAGNSSTNKDSLQIYSQFGTKLSQLRSTQNKADSFNYPDILRILSRKLSQINLAALSSYLNAGISHVAGGSARCEAGTFQLPSKYSRTISESLQHIAEFVAENAATLTLGYTVISRQQMDDMIDAAAKQICSECKYTKNTTRSQLFGENAIPPNCDNSSRESRKLFCLTCNMTTCKPCAVINNHTGHELCPLPTGQDQQNAKTALKEFPVIEEMILLNLKQLYSNIESSMRRVYAALEGQERRLLDKLDELNNVRQTFYNNNQINLYNLSQKLSLVHLKIYSSVKNNNNVEARRNLIKVIYEMKRLRVFIRNNYVCESVKYVFIHPEIDLKKIGQLGKVFVVTANSAAPPTCQMERPTSIWLPAYPVPMVRNYSKYTEQKCTPMKVFGKKGDQSGEFDLPWGVCCSQLGHIYVADRRNNRIQIFDIDGNHLFSFGTFGDGPGQFNRPTGIACSPEGNIVVVDKDNHRIQVLDNVGNFLFCFGGKGSGKGEFNYPWDVACCKENGDIVVSDTRNHRVQLFNRNGIYLAKFGSEECVPMMKMFNLPRGVDFTVQGGIVVTDFENHQLIQLNHSLTMANYHGKGQFNRPQGIVCDKYGNLIVTEARSYRVQLFNIRMERKWCMGYKGNEPGEFDIPSGICLSPNGNIIVVDSENNRVQIFPSSQSEEGNRD